MSLQTSFPVTRRVLRPPADWANLPPLDELESWVSSVGVKLGPLIPTAEDRLKVLQLLYRYKHLDGQNLSNLPPTDLILHRVRLIPGTKPYNARSQKRWPPHTEWWMRKLVQDGIDGGVYERTQTANGRLSDWNSRIVMVDKVDNPTPEDEPRTTFNYSNVKETMPGCYLELMSKVHDYLADPRHKVYFMADIKHGYYNVLLHPDDRHIFAFTIPGIGQLQPTRMPQGSRSAGFTMSELMNITLGPIPPPDPEPSLLHPVERIEWAKMKLLFKKLHLFIPKIRALGVDHIVGGEIKIIEERIRKIVEWPIPTNVRGVRAFLGSISITRRWVKNFAEMARPLTRLTGDTEWKWTESESLSFDLLRIKCAATVSMHGIDWSIQFHFYSDASGYAGGLVVTQFQVLPGYKKPAEVPILYDAFTFNQAERRYPTYKRELCAIVKFAVKHNHLLRNPDPKMYGVLHTDHMPLVRFLESELHDGIYGHWVAKLRELNVKLQYIKGPRNKVADGLSRTIFRDEACTDDSVVSALRAEVDKHRSDPQWFWKDGKGGYDSFLGQLTEPEKEEVLTSGTINGLNVFALDASSSWSNAYQASEWFGHAYRFVRDGTIPTSLHESKRATFMRKCLDYRIDENGILWTYQRGLHLPCVPESKVAATLHEAHDEGGHWAKEGTLAKLRRNVYWPSQSTDVERYIAGCLPCARHEPATRSAQLQPINVARPFQLIGMDFIGPIGGSDKNKYILHIIDYFSRYSMAYPTPSANAEDVKTCLLDVFHRYVCPSAIYCDRGQHFDNQYIKDFLDGYNVRIRFSPSGASKSTGMVEVGNRILESVIRKGSDKWDDKLPSSIKQLNARVIGHLKYSPLEILHGLPPQPLQRQTYSQITDADTDQLIDLFTRHPYQSEAVEAHLLSLARLRDEISERSIQKKESEKERYDRGILRSNELEPGDLAMLYQKNVGKLQPRWRGPFLIEAFGGDHGVSYTIRQIGGRRIKGAFHSDHLRKFTPRTGHLIPQLELEIPSHQTIRKARPRQKARDPLALGPRPN